MNTWDRYKNSDGSFQSYFYESWQNTREWPDERLVRVHYASTFQQVIPDSAIAAIEYEMYLRNVHYTTTPNIITRVNLYKNDVFERYVSFASEDELKTYT